ncbi:bifunctional phosphopantothenoylcysteine decarboxylase/phosphopantothenate--cysteine ligase CoaBC [Listeria cossartiae subsp. cayugensis]|uniref:bifunctional phosphopantothenoylcysteine decarboxylase/phosphopantothenate--cysteine ligase CoaBC n=1 Tax=Listeria cossartiae TaxID=2838249 RepID=UPI002880B7F2|nr:bifunctional phosphopantothenoylcysteine decarboxylase/phosphopantothenate--cysteine ligase CoaBC [Listeria cossartiae]MDT0000151.1 bifunctional phosphopantothenoylcysteine decarboxylase/phosphopantothenate--cysteine ligase CoaBC [Listeria cossartiae subsp. cayugensis]MDT0008761.1 bifunctional phosphopantothenoylcysteine decarboxylase/phosphopantothenate--cysteine ligase CoaBC [Listeria cossartiae subsp. cayugensis]MDT0030593.1 bifunctional phosphopantothenoylcysteine decarboxylase/phosphopan
MQGKNILLAVSGGIAVYKAVALTSKLTQAGANVKVMMTEHAQEFVPPLSFQVLSKNDVYTDTFDEKKSSVVAHINLADWADLVIVAPATANVIGKMANGIADDMVTTTILATEAPVWVAPAMNVHMIQHPAVIRNINQLYADGVRFIEPEEGYLACGYVGRGRLEEPEKIVLRIAEFFQEDNDLLRDKNVLVTAGATREKLDPVRYFTNHSTGKMGFSIAESAARHGANVTLVTTSKALPVPPGVEAIYVESAEEMYQAVNERKVAQDVFVMTAAVADYTPAQVSDQKIKKQPGDFTIEMKRTKDILLEIGQHKTAEQVVIGFAAETENLEANALKKLTSKNADMIVANNISEAGAGFSGDTNIVTFYREDGSSEALPILDKKEVAEHIIEEAANFLRK